MVTGRQFGILSWIATVALMLIAAIAYQVGYRINATPSMPKGIYKTTHTPHSARRGAIVTLCPPDTPRFQKAAERGYLGFGNCPGHYRTLLKPIAAIAGDTVKVQPEGVWVNDRFLPNSAPLKTDSQGHPMTAYPTGVYQVKTGEVWLISSHSPKSFDSRYFGPLPEQQIQATATPFLLIEPFKGTITP